MMKFLFLWVVPKVFIKELYIATQENTLRSLHPNGKKALWTVLPLGYVNTPFEYQRPMDIITVDLRNMLVSVDECLMSRRDECKHYCHLVKMMERDEKYNVIVRLGKTAILRKDRTKV
ncbi:hypothetical protein Zmor_027078 [Zophobas morio]|jgi:hypothetical protein|uniref:Reverse transcriptase domain-containing protein n=1 Tax=Zophobas morio TaxID=2755281 RepID=A0AA38HNQ6_9CUCU|nr:hypothetical protein Zmor_027078 [Zophobas morio]